MVGDHIRTSGFHFLPSITLILEFKIICFDLNKRIGSSEIEFLPLFLGDNNNNFLLHSRCSAPGHTHLWKIQPHSLAALHSQPTLSHTMRFTTKLLPSRSGNLGILQLNNPKPLHALTLDMFHAIQDMLEGWKEDDSMKALLVKSNTKEAKTIAFCAGGDVKSIYQSIVDGDDDDINNATAIHGQGTPGLFSADFFRTEYKVDHMFATQFNEHKPQISFWDGIVMGGGVGISVHSTYRVATENTVFSMPETAIGLFPDVGSMYWMPRLLPSSGIAVYLALTGARLKASDLLYCGLATHYVPSAELDNLERALVEATEASSSVAPVLMSFHQSPPTPPDESALAKQRSNIDQVFGSALQDEDHTVEMICERLAAMNDDDFGQSTLSTLQKMSPTSLKVTLEALRRGAEQPTLADDLAMEFRISQGFLRSGEFQEGVRAALVDKDGAPKWNPATLEEVTPEMVESFFGPIDHEWDKPSDDEKSASSKL